MSILIACKFLKLNTPLKYRLINIIKEENDELFKHSIWALGSFFFKSIHGFEKTMSVVATDNLRSEQDITFVYSSVSELSGPTHSSRTRPQRLMLFLL